MNEHPCEIFGKIFNRKSNWIFHTQNKKNQCVIKNNIKIGEQNKIIGANNISNPIVNSDKHWSIVQYKQNLFIV